MYGSWTMVWTHGRTYGGEVLGGGWGLKMELARVQGNIYKAIRKKRK